MTSFLATTKPRAVVKPAPPRGLRRYEAWLIPLGIALISRLVVFVSADLLVRYVLGQYRIPPQFTGVVTVWQRNDALWYLAIAEHGYNYSPLIQSRANFFPLYPALVYLFTPIAKFLHVAEPYAVTGMAISWITFALACVLLYQFTMRRFGKGVAVGAVTLLCLFPYSFYYGATYTESIYLVLAVGAFLAAERGNWWVASAAAGLVSASRPPGLLIGGCIGLAYLLDWWRTRHPLRADVLSLALTPLGTAAYMFYCWVNWGDPLAYLKTSEAGWGGGHLQAGGLRYIEYMLRHPVSWFGPPSTWFGVPNRNHILAYVAMLVVFVFLALTPLTLRLLGPVYAFFTLASIMAPILDFPTANSLGRYMSVIFPVFIVVAYLLRDHTYLRWGLYIAGSLLLIPFAAYFAAGMGLP